MQELETLYKAMRKEPSQEEKDFIAHAYTFSKKAHEGQMRASGEPYFNHVYKTALNLAEFGMGATTVAAGLLHDVVEDTEVTFEDLEQEFNQDVSFLVKGVTKLGKVKYRGRERHVESLRKFFVAIAEDVRVIIIKLADRLHNAETLKYLKPEKAKRIALETIEIHAPLANRLGMWKLKGKLEDLAFPYAYPKEADQVKELLKQKERSTERDLEDVYKKLRKELALHSIPVESAGYRVKGVYSLWKKLQEKHMDIDKVYDIVALRVIVPAVEDCYRVLGIIHSHWRPFPGRIKDFIALPKPNGYQSLHTTIFTGNGGIAEIQIRTQDMHDQAELGIAAHFEYKGEQEAKIKKTSRTGIPSWIHEMKELQSGTEDPEQFLKNLRVDFFNKRIFVFTPDGDVIDLPQGSTAIDFAYAIHSDIGNTISSAKINGKHSAIYTELKNGDLVRIETSKNSKPTSKWFEAAKTTTAKKHIRKYLDDNSLMKKILNRFN